MGGGEKEKTRMLLLCIVNIVEKKFLKRQIFVLFVAIVCKMQKKQR